MRAFVRFFSIALTVFGSLLAVGLYLKHRPVPPPPPLPVETARPSPIALPGDFPFEHAGHILQAAQKEPLPNGVRSYEAAIYWSASDVESEISVRLLGLVKETAGAFVNAFLREIAQGSRELAEPILPEESGWEEARLFDRGGAGLFVAWADSAMLLVCAGSPAVARTFGSSLVLRAGKSGAGT
ncbi:MAG: hypothetical protein N2322_01415 [Terrimicrobiaceae bacterium]|nr:hypothetical protein [Terrimicrobiaceae bacterium]